MFLFVGTDILECVIHLVEYDELWGHFEKPEKTGAAYMTELCENSNERRGVGINRWACYARFLQVSAKES